MTFLGGTGNLYELTDVSTGAAQAVQGDYLIRDAQGLWAPTGQTSVAALDARIFTLETRMLQLPNASDISNMSRSLSSRFNVLSESDFAQQEQIDEIISAFAGLNSAIVDLELAFVAHTGATGQHV